MKARHIKRRALAMHLHRLRRFAALQYELIGLREHGEGCLFRALAEQMERDIADGTHFPCLLFSTEW